MQHAAPWGAPSVGPDFAKKVCVQPLKPVQRAPSYKTAGKRQLRRHADLRVEWGGANTLFVRV